MTSSLVHSVSAVVLATSGLGLLFVPDVLLAFLHPDGALGLAGVGQLLGASWLGLAALNWLSRTTVLGGIYGRPVLLANLSLYFIGGVSMLGAARHTEPTPAYWGVTLVLLALALVYGWLLFRGPFQRDRPAHQHRSASRS